MTRQKKSEVQKLFLEAYIKYGNLTGAARHVGIERKNHYRWLEKDKNYATAFADAEEQAIDLLEQEARKRATVGNSDTLLIFLLKGARPEKYRERYEVGGKFGGKAEPVTIKVEYVNGKDGKPTDD